MLALDTYILEALYFVRDPLFVQGFIWVSELGRAWTLYALTLIVLILLISKRHYAYAAGLSITMGVSGLGTLLLKGFFERARPPADFQAYLETWYSFPSAHAALATAFYCFQVFLVFRFTSSKIVRSLAIVTCAILILLISFSRLYLGVHYASDVLVGMVFGLACVLLGSKITRNLTP